MGKLHSEQKAFDDDFMYEVPGLSWMLCTLRVKIL